MALKGASTTQDQDWLDLKELAAENAAAVFTVQEIEDSVDFGNGPIEPVRARVIVLTGRHAGEVYPDERILPKGVRMKLTEIGDDVVGRLSIYGARKAVGLNAEHDGDIELAEAALAKLATSKVATGTKKKPAAVITTEDDDDPPF
jgi:hypothetical protein